MITVTKKTAQRGVVPIPLLVVGAVVLLVGVLVASGALKLNFTVTKTGENGQKQNVVDVRTPSQPTTKLSAEAYTNSNFSISYPDGWKVKSASNMVSIIRNSGGGILIITNPLGVLSGAKLATVADANKLVAKEQFKNANFISEKETKLNGQDAWRYELTANNDGTDIKVIYYVLADSKNMYVVMGTASVVDWSETEADINTSFATFKLAK